MPALTLREALLEHNAASKRLKIRVGKLYRVHTALHGQPAANHAATVIARLAPRRWRVQIRMDGRDVYCTVLERSFKRFLGEGAIPTKERRRLTKLAPVWG